MALSKAMPDELPYRNGQSSDKHGEITSLLHELEESKGPGSGSAEADSILLNLKQHTRSSEGAESLSTPKSICTLSRFGLDLSPSATAREALKCLANILLLEMKTRQIFVDYGYPSKAAERLKSDNRDDELLATRILFLCTYDTTLDFNPLFDGNSLAESMCIILERHAKRYAGSRYTSTSIDSMALCETLKLLFNLTQHYPDQGPKLSHCLTSLLEIIEKIHIPSPPLQQPLTYLINALLNLDFAYVYDDPLSGASVENFRSHVSRLVSILDQAVRQYQDEELERLAPPLLALLRKIFQLAPLNIQDLVKLRLLPSDLDRAKPLGKSDTLSSALLRLSTSPVAPNLRQSISSMMFELSDQDAASFVRNVGYGYASGFLMSHGISVPEDILDAVHSGESESEPKRSQSTGETFTTIHGKDINPITGQRRDMEPTDTLPPMTDDEREREAERLFVLFERLRATGVMDVQNPVDQAIQGGRFEELG